MNTEKLIITDVNTLGIGYDRYSVQDATIHSNCDNGVRWIDLYVKTEDIETKERRKLKIRIDGGKFNFSYISEEEWKENVSGIADKQ